MSEFDLIEFLPDHRRLELTVLLGTVPVYAAVVALFGYNAYVSPILGTLGPAWSTPLLIAACSLAFLVPWYLVHGLGAARLRVGQDGLEITRPSGRQFTLSWDDPELSLRLSTREYLIRPRKSWLGFYDHALIVRKPRVATEVPVEAYEQIVAIASSHGLKIFEIRGRTRAWNWQQTVIEARGRGS